MKFITPILSLLIVSSFIYAGECSNLVPYKRVATEYYTYPAEESKKTSTPKHLFILSGQSNMEYLDLKISFVPAIINALGEDSIIIVKDALGAQPISRWDKDWVSTKGEPRKNNGDLYDRLLSKTKMAIEGQTIQSVTFLWMQGEKDAVKKQSAVYATSFKRVIQQIKTDLNWDKDLYFVIGRLSDANLNNPRIPDWNKMRDIQVSLAEESLLGAWVNTDDLNNRPDKKTGEITDNVHYSKEGYKIFGERLAQKAIEIIK